MKEFGRVTIFCLAGLSVFSFAFSLLAERGLWPGLPPGALHGTDLWAGLVGGTILFLILALKRRVE